MEDINIKWLLEVLPRLIRENDTVKGAIITALSGVVATKEDIKALIAEMDKRFEAMDKRFEAMQQQMDKRFDAVDKRFETIDRRFDGVDKRLDTVQQQMDSQHGQVMSALSSIQRSIGAPFEQFARNVVSRILEGEGMAGVVLKKARVADPNGEVFPSTKEIEIDGISEKPAVIIEITAIMKDRQKVEKFLMKKAFIEKRDKKTYRGFFVASGSELPREEIADIAVLLKRHGAELLNL
jgi:hypothetical protein